MKLQKCFSAFLVCSMFLTTTIPQNLQARTFTDHKVAVKPSAEKIADAFNKFRYDMTVEWDQRDPNFKENAQKNLENSLIALKAEGVSSAEILSYMKKNILDEKVAKDYDRLLNAIQEQNLNETEASKVAMNYMEKNYKEGVGFSAGGSTSYRRVMIIAGILIIGVVTYIIIHDRHNDNDDSQNEEENDDKDDQHENDDKDDNDDRDNDDHENDESDEDDEGGFPCFPSGKTFNPCVVL